MKTAISVKVDKDVKEKAQEVASSAGITLSALVNAYLIQVANTRRIEIFAAEEMTPGLEKLIEEVEQERIDGEISGPFDSVDAMIDDLEK